MKRQPAAILWTFFLTESGFGWMVNETKLDATTAVLEWIAPHDEGTVIFQAQTSDGENPPLALEKVLRVVRPQIDVPDVVPDVDLSKHSVPLDRIYFDTFGSVSDLVVPSRLVK